jgi:hypothetical protein
MGPKSLITLIILVLQLVSLRTWAEALVRLAESYELKMQIVNIGQSL